MGPTQATVRSTGRGLRGLAESALANAGVGGARSLDSPGVITSVDSGIPTRNGGTATVLLGVGFELVRGAVAASSERTYLGFLGSWVKFRTEVVRLPVFLERMSDARDRVFQVLRYIAYAYSVLGLRQSTLAGHLAAVQFFHRSSCSGELDTGHPLIRNALKGVARGHADVGTQQRVRQPVPWGVLKAGGKLVPAWGSGGRVLFLALCASFFFLTPSCEMFAVSRSAMHEVHGLRRGNVAFFQGPDQLPSARWECADRVELRFRSSKGDQFRKGAVVTRVRVGPRCRSEAGGGAVDVMTDLLSCCRALPSHAPLVAFDVGGGRWSMWSKHQAVAALRQVVALAGLPPMEYALHSLRIGGPPTWQLPGQHRGCCGKRGAGPGRRVIAHTYAAMEGTPRGFPRH